VGANLWTIPFYPAKTCRDTRLYCFQLRQTSAKTEKGHVFET
jgi:hypothetical protein